MASSQRSFPSAAAAAPPAAAADGGSRAPFFAAYVTGKSAPKWGMGVTVEGLRKHFGKYATVGKLGSVRLSEQRSSGSSRDFAFLDFTAEADLKD